MSHQQTDPVKKHRPPKKDSPLRKASVIGMGAVAGGLGGSALGPPGIAGGAAIGATVAAGVLLGDAKLRKTKAGRDFLTTPIVSAKPKIPRPPAAKPATRRQGVMGRARAKERERRLEK